MTSILRLIRVWLQPTCIDCGQPKPRFTAYCDHCWTYHADDYWEAQP